ncbi:MAG: D-2-hydroxyacid dehydrogenase family protein [Deltaproteobacteria bacterium]|nr:D-2-hydroxyacid dehydrogenase family protein [Deltaproteobacteria bacterium]
MSEASNQKFEVLVFDDYEDVAAKVPAYEKLKARAHVTILRERLDTPAKMAQAVGGVNAILMLRERTRFGENEFALAPDLKLISQTGRRAAHLDLAAATRRGIPVAVTTNDNGMSTTELTIGLILGLMRRIPQLDRRMRHELWPAVAGNVVEGKTAGVIGFGRIGREVARILRAFRMRVLASTRTLTEEQAREVGAERASMETLLKESDIVTIHIPLNDQTRGILGEKEISLMKPGAIFVNTSRGPLVSESALVRALENGGLGGAGLDVFDVEPLPLDHPLRKLDNVILLPHRGYAALETLEELFNHAMTNILDYLDGKPVNLLNPEVRSR